MHASSRLQQFQKLVPEVIITTASGNNGIGLEHVDSCMLATQFILSLVLYTYAEVQKHVFLSLRHLKIGCKTDKICTEK